MQICHDRLIESSVTRDLYPRLIGVPVSTFLEKRSSFKGVVSKVNPARNGVIFQNKTPLLFFPSFLYFSSNFRLVERKIISGEISRVIINIIKIEDISRERGEIGQFFAPD